ncbi:hypothetical protein M569_03727 [Genlisea aurea]|uniref:Uncharacterized protein n=1 Tax=Genlisea aurea TaxID=192259 RepID=S8EEQ5_9LAMI|nr:hypothetical protein M569_03727 [Genlisea aurea]
MESRSEREVNFSGDFQDQPIVYNCVRCSSTAAGEWNSGKRNSPLETERSLKRPAENGLCCSPPSAAVISNYSLVGFNKLDLPHSFPAFSGTPLRRTGSGPVFSTDTNFSGQFPPPTHQEPQRSCLSPIMEASFSQEPQRMIQNQPQLIQRTTSDPTPFASPPTPTAVINSTPPRPPRSRNDSPGCGESPTAKEKMKQMKRWCDRIVTETADEENQKEHREETVEDPTDEAVSVEENGDILVLRFKCTCGHGFEILLSGKSCYYKLTG